MLIFISAITYAQPPQGKRDKVKSLKIAFISDELALTPQEAEKFWPIYNTFEDKQFVLRHEKMKSYIPVEFEGNIVSCLNERLSFLKYLPGEYFKPHEDGYYIRPDNSEISYITVQIYLNDLKEEDGGATTFIKDTYNKIYQDYSVIPKVGRVLLFEHELEHEGSILKNGLKYCIRTDVMYNIIE